MQSIQNKPSPFPHVIRISKQRRDHGGFGTAGVAARWLGVILAACLGPASALAEPLYAWACASQTFSSLGNACFEAKSGINAMAQHGYDNGVISLNAGTSAAPGSLMAQSRAMMQHMTDWSSGYINASTDATVNESIDPDWEDWAARGYDSMGDIDHYAFDFQFEVSGSQSATYGGWGAVWADSRVSYNYSVGGTQGAGSKSTYANENYGTWGIVDASFLIGKGQSYILSMRAQTSANGTKTYVPGSDASIDAFADFSHTLRWMGIAGLHAFDASGNEIPLPADAYMPLIGRDTGFDYWYAAPALVPLPPTLLAIGSGLIGLVPFARRKRGQPCASPCSDGTAHA